MKKYITVLAICIVSLCYCHAQDPPLVVDKGIAAIEGYYMIRFRAVDVLHHWETRVSMPIDYEKEERCFTVQVNGRRIMSGPEIYSLPPFKRDGKYIPGVTSVEPFPPGGWSWKDCWYRLEGDNIHLYKVFHISGHAKKLELEIEQSDIPYPLDKWLEIMYLPTSVTSCSYWIIFDYSKETLDRISLPCFQPFEYSPKATRQIRRATRKQIHKKNR